MLACPMQALFFGVGIGHLHIVGMTHTAPTRITPPPQWWAALSCMQCTFMRYSIATNRLADCGKYTGTEFFLCTSQRDSTEWYRHPYGVATQFATIKPQLLLHTWLSNKLICRYHITANMTQQMYIMLANITWISLVQYMYMYLHSFVCHYHES